MLADPLAVTIKMRGEPQPIKIFGGDEYTVTWVAEQGPAAKSGLAVDDRILSINDVEFGTSNQQHNKFYAEASRITNTAPIKSLLVKRGDQLLEMDIRLEKNLWLSCGSSRE